MSQYENPALWTPVPREDGGKRYASVPAEIPKTWHRAPNSLEPGCLVYSASEYRIVGRVVSGTKRRHYTVWRQGAELPLSLTGSLRDAKRRAIKNALGEDRMDVA
jgi:hypothetical protein